MDSRPGRPEGAPGGAEGRGRGDHPPGRGGPDRFRGPRDGSRDQRPPGRGPRRHESQGRPDRGGPPRQDRAPRYEGASRAEHAPRGEHASERPRLPGPAQPRPALRPHGRPGTQYLYGINPIARALAVGKRKLFRLWLREGRLSDALEGLHAAMTAHGLPISEAPVADLTNFAGSESHQGAVLECGALPLETEEDALALLGAEPVEGAPPPVLRGPGQPLLVVLDQVEDPQNFGAIVRSCAVFGASGVVVARHHAAPPSAAASKASAGELEAFPVFEAANLSRFLEACKARGAWTAAAVAEGGQSLHTFQRDTPLVLVVGNEGRGLRPLVEKHCDFKLTIPVRPGTSLNVSAATAVLLYGVMGDSAKGLPGVLAPPPGVGDDGSNVV